MTDYQFTFAGVTFGAGTSIYFAGADGLEDLPPSRNGDTDRAYTDGQIAGLDLASGRDITLELVVTNGGSGFAANIESLKALSVFAAGSESQLVFSLPGRTSRFVMCRPRRRALPVGEDYQFRVGRAVLQFHATDPRIYDTTLLASTIALPTASGGLTFPAAAPFVFGSAGSGGSFVAANAGNYAAPWVAQFNGPLVNPTITHAGLGRTLTFNGTLIAGDVLTIDSLARTVILNGTASRYSWVGPSSQWFGLAPGNNTIQFGAASGSGTLTFNFRSTWL